MNFNVIIPAAGIGTRLRPHTFTLPKVLLEVAGQPIIGHILDKIAKLNADEIYIISGYMGDKLNDYLLKTYPNLNIKTIDQPERKGLGHAISLVKDFIDKEKPLLIILGDTLIEIDLSSMLNSDYSVIAVKEVEDPRRFGVVELKDGFIKALVEKPEVPPTNLAIVGLYYFKETGLLFDGLDYIIRENITTKGEYQLTDAMQYMLNSGVKMVTQSIGQWFDCGKPETLLYTNRVLLQEIGDATSTKDYLIIPPVIIGKDADIKSSVIGPDVSIGDNVSISDSIIKDSIIYDGVVLEGVNLSSSIIGCDAIVKAKPDLLNIGDSSEIDL
jgi:glucose-1-phosphate thymidylyltransferase